MRWMKALVLVCGFGLPLGLVVMPGEAQAGSKVGIKVRVVHATKDSRKIDKRLSKISKHLTKLGYTGFSLLETESAEISPKGKKSFTIAGGRKLTVAVLSKDSKRARLRVEIQGKKGKLVDTTVSIRRNGFFIVAGPKYKGGILVLPISARY